jgi:hypothetical protein
MLTSPDKVLLGRYHARELTLSEIQRRRIDASNSLKVSKKAMKKLESEPHEENDPAWLQRVGRQTQEIRRIEAEKNSANEELNKHINGRALPLFEAPPDDVAVDCITGGIALLLEQGHDREHILEVIEREFQIAEFRHRYEEMKPEVRDTPEGQATLFAEEEDRGQVERRLAHMLGRNFPAPLPFCWLEVLAHLSDAEVRTAWAWAAAPHRIEQPQCIVDIMHGKEMQRFERDPKLPAVVRLTDEAATRIGKELVLEIDDTGRVLLTAPDAPVAEIGTIEPAQAMIPVFAAVRLLGAAANGYQTTRDDWTWHEREERRKAAVEGMSGVDNGGFNDTPATAPIEGETAGDAVDGVEKPAPAPRDATSLTPREIKAALRKSEGNLTAAAKSIGCSRDALRRRCVALEINIEEFREAGGREDE